MIPAKLITATDAAAKCGVELKRMLGFCARREFVDPIVLEQANGEYMVLDDWRLSRLMPHAE